VSLYSYRIAPLL